MMRGRIGLVIGTLGFFVLAFVFALSVKGYQLVTKHLFDTTYHVMSDKPTAIDLHGVPMIGNPSAPTTIVEFGDFKCPTCMQWEKAVFSPHVQQLIQSGQAKLYFQPYLVISHSTDAALAGLSIYNHSHRAFAQYYNDIYQHQLPESQNWATPKFLTQFVQQFIPTVSAQTVLTDIEQKRDLGVINEAKSLGNQIGVSTTPTVYVDGYRLQNPFDYKAIEKLVQRDNQRKG